MPPVLGHGLLALLEGLWHMGVYLGLTLNGWSMEHYHSAWYYSQPLGIRCGGGVHVGFGREKDVRMGLRAQRPW